MVKTRSPTQAQGTWIEIEVRPPAGRTSRLLRQTPASASYLPFGTLTSGVDSVIHDADLGVGDGYCYRIEVTGGGLPDETHTRCDITDWRVFIGLERRIVGGLSRRIELGYVFLRKLEYQDVGSEIDLSDTLMVRGGLIY